MTLDRDSRLVRWAYLWERVPPQAGLCAIFWRTVLFTPYKVVFTASVVGLACAFVAVAGGIILYGFMSLLIEKPIYAFDILIGLSVSVLLFEHVLWWKQVDVEEFMEQVTEAPLVAGALAVKRGICPIVTIE